MTITQYSNIFNLICQGLTTVNYYHFGTLNEINLNPENNFNPNNSTGKYYPAVFCVPPSGSLQIENSNGRAYGEVLSFNLVFADLLYYGNDSLNNTRSLAEVSSELYQTVINFFASLQAAARLGTTTGRNRYLVSSVSWDAAPFTHNDRLLAINTNFTLTALSECPTEEPDITALPAPFVYPPTDNDYELL